MYVSICRESVAHRDTCLTDRPHHLMCRYETEEINIFSLLRPRGVGKKGVLGKRLISYYGSAYEERVNRGNTSQQSDQHKREHHNKHNNNNNNSGTTIR
eukprot:gene11908-8190_t